MGKYKLKIVNLHNETEVKMITEFVNKENFKLEDFDYSIYLVNEKDKIIATCSKRLNVLKCLVVSPDYHGQNLAKILIEVITKQIQQEKFEEVFVITKSENKTFFEKYNFNLIYSNGKTMFMTNNKSSIQSYKDHIIENSKKGENGAIVVNANPFTKGHLYLVETAASEVENLYVIPVKEDASFFSYEERLAMIKSGTRHLKNVKVLDGSNYIISKSIFPSYFIQCPEELIKQQTRFDSEVFCELFKEGLNIKKRFVGTEPFSPTTKMYNDAMKEVLCSNDIQVIEIERIKFNGTEISASLCRRLLEDDFEKLVDLVPLTTIDALRGMDLKSKIEINRDKIIKTH
ncbi:GNAT family N-acetyltransferase [[Acholeplasma] multilocale]|uniref:GNAT family N-acetyltransferase n=1 Tax=[Acholeplasma] multilocale TaxID=264638 RepID=UPI00041E573B|nr:GNAT family N-acetyltransferase [[Acholeplasma] multilocale]